MNIIIDRLNRVHRRMDQEIKRELGRRAPDWMRLARLKKLKLAVKDRLHARLRRRRALVAGRA